MAAIAPQKVFYKHLFFNSVKSEVSITLCCQLCSTHYTAVWIKNCLTSTSAIKVVTINNTDNFCYEGKRSRATAKLTLFAVSKDEWDTKEDTGKSMKNALYVLQYAKRHLSGRSNIKQWKNYPIALAVIKLRLFEGIRQLLSQLISQSVENSVNPLTATTAMWQFWYINAHSITF